MYSLLVLGLIPGTNIQIDFWAWIGLMISFLIILRLGWHHIKTAATRHWQNLYDEDGLHDPWHASRFHRRLQLKAR